MKKAARDAIGVAAVLASFTLGSAMEPDPLTPLWTRINPEAGRYFAGQDLAVDPGGNLYLSGWSWDGKTYFRNHRDTARINLVKIDGKGGKVWSYGLSGTALALDRQGNVIVFGNTDDTTVTKVARGTTDFCLIKYSPDGKPMWTRVFGTDSLDLSKDVATDEAGNIYLLGSTPGAFPGQRNRGGADLCALKFSPEGKMLWSRTWGSKEHDSPWEISLGEGGTLLVSGEFAGPEEGAPGSRSRLPGQYSITLKENGEELSRHPLQSARGPVFRQIRGEDGHLFVVGYTEKDSAGGMNLASEIHMTRLDKHRKELWTRHLGMPGDKRPGDFFGDKAGNLYAAGVTEFPKENHSRIFIFKYDPEGNLAYQYFRRTSLGDQVLRIAVDAEGDILLLGRARGVPVRFQDPIHSGIFVQKLAQHAPPSFDCQQAATVQEHLICKHARLSACDDSIAVLYAEYLAQSRAPERRKAEHAAWIRDVRNARTTEAGLDSVMSARIFELRGRTEENLIRRTGEDPHRE